MRTAIAILGASLITWIGGCGPSDTRATVELASAITNGTVDEGDSAVVALLSSGQAYCTGTVVADRWVLTAAHCLQSMSPSEIYVGTRPSDSGQRLQVARTIIHPRFNFIGLENDVGLVKLAVPAPMTPLRLMRQPLDQSWVGSMVRLVGFGSTSSTEREPLLKRTGTGRITVLDTQKFTLEGAPSQTCITDSGAPALYEQDGVDYVVGVSSSGDAHCQEYGRIVRVDAYTEDFILATMAGSDSHGCQSSPAAAPDSTLLVLALVFLRAAVRRRVPPG